MPKRKKLPLISPPPAIDPPTTNRRKRQIHSVPAVAFGLPLDNSYGRQVFQGVLAYLRKYPRWQIPVKSNTPYLPWSSLRRWRGDGIIGIFVSEEQFQEIETLKIPTVNLGPSNAPEERLPTVRVDDWAIGRLAAQHLLELGLRNFIFFGDEKMPFCCLRRDGFLSAVESEGGRVSVQNVQLHPDVGQLTKSGWYMEALLRSPKPVGVYGATDRIAFGVLEACRKQHLQVPAEVAVIGTNADDILCQLASPELSSVNASSPQVGYNAAHLLDFLMGRSTTRPTQCVVPPGIIHVRASSDDLAYVDPNLAGALRFIREHTTQPIYVPDIVRANPLSRRSLEMLFRKHRKRSISDEIRLAHAGRAKKLLKETNLTISEIARLAGFSSVAALEATFHKFNNISATAYRNGSFNERQSP